MVNTRSGLSTNPSLENKSSLDVLYTVSLLTALYQDDNIVLSVYDKFSNLSNRNKKIFLKDLQEQYDILQIARTIF
jgi:hypothetical protein